MLAQRPLIGGNVSRRETVEAIIAVVPLARCASTCHTFWSGIVRERRSAAAVTVDIDDPASPSP